MRLLVHTRLKGVAAGSSPYHTEEAGNIIADFFESASDGTAWDKISRAGLERIRSRCAPACLIRLGLGLG